ncbi:MAG: GNAT family N-acetyltransferase [Thermoprotei archaeon]
MDIHIRCAETSDLKNLGILWMSMIKELDLSLSDPSTALKIWLNHVALLIAEDPCQVLIAHYKDLIIGYAIIELSNLVPILRVFGYAVLTDLYVRKEWRGKGIGTLLLKKAEDIALSKGFLEVRLSVLKDADAIRFYKNSGYEDYGIIMRKKLKINNYDL